ncbi:MAG: hypothetical protein JO145_15000 [Acidobacteriaceae bacterium]|nr:hypothetical protein [Acidobacteriaceae bacterium]
MRRRLDYPVFDPGLLKVAGWSPRDHGEFFLEVIRKYAKECWFLDEWEYSVGASKEFVFCWTIKTPCYSECGEQISVIHGIRLIRQAADFTRSLHLDDTKLRSRADDLVQLGTAAEEPEISGG